MVDANLGWPVDLIDESPRWDEDFAAEVACGMEPHGVAWLEEPLNRGDFQGLARLRRRTKTPLAGGEINASWTDFKALLDAESLDVYQPDAAMVGGTFAGGISVVYWIIREIQRRNGLIKADARRLRYSPHTWTTGLGFAVNLQLMGVVPEEERSLLELPLDINWEPWQWARFIKGGFGRDAEGRVRIPDGPGLGVEIDWSVIQRFGERISVDTPALLGGKTLLDRGLRETLYLRRKKAELAERTAHAEFSVPEPPF